MSPGPRAQHRLSGPHEVIKSRRGDGPSLNIGCDSDVRGVSLEFLYSSVFAFCQ